MVRFLIKLLSTEWKEHLGPGSFNWPTDGRKDTPPDDDHDALPIRSGKSTSAGCDVTNQEPESRKEDADRVWSREDETRGSRAPAARRIQTPAVSSLHALSSHTSGGVWLNKVRRSFAGWTGRGDGSNA